MRTLRFLKLAGQLCGGRLTLGGTQILLLLEIVVGGEVSVSACFVLYAIRGRCMPPCEKPIIDM